MVRARDVIKSDKNTTDGFLKPYIKWFGSCYKYASVKGTEWGGWVSSVVLFVFLVDWMNLSS